MLSACKSKSDNNSNIDSCDDNIARSLITSEEADIILEQLEEMLIDVCDIAEKLNNKGISPKNLRDSLQLDSTYISIAQKASRLDSILLNYMATSTKGHDLRIKYNAVVTRNLRRAQKAGLS